MGQLDNRRIYVVDDDEDDQFIITQSLAEHVPLSTIQLFESGEKLLSNLALKGELPQLVLLDLNMPRMGGLETLELIRSNRVYDSLPVIILTTSDSDWDRQRAAELNADDYLVKPGTMGQMSQLMMQVKRDWL